MLLAFCKHFCKQQIPLQMFLHPHPVPTAFFCLCVCAQMFIQLLKREKGANNFGDSKKKKTKTQTLNPNRYPSLALTLRLLRL